MKLISFVVACSAFAMSCGDDGVLVPMDAPVVPDAPPHTLEFWPKSSIATTGGADTIALGDFNDDGKPDLAVTTGKILVYTNITPTNNTKASFAPRLDLGNSNGAIAVADLNGDLKVDLAVTEVATGVVLIFLNNASTGTATASFAQPVTFTVGMAPEGIAAADLNRDGKLDLVTSNFDDNTISVLLNTTAIGAATPTFDPKLDINVAGVTGALAVGDLNADDKPDIVVGRFGISSAVAIVQNTTVSQATTATFAPGVDLMTGINPLGIALADLDRDGKRDLAVVNFGSSTVSTFLNTTGAGSPTFGATLDLPTASRASAVGAGDLDGDGKIDLVVANQEASVMSVFLGATTAGASSPSFASRVDFEAGSGPGCVAVGDLNGDGHPDIVAGLSADPMISILMAR